MGKLARLGAKSKGRTVPASAHVISPAFRHKLNTRQVANAIREIKRKGAPLQNGEKVTVTMEPSGAITMRGTPVHMRPHASPAEIQRALSEMKAGMREASNRAGTKAPEVVLSKAGRAFERRLKLAGMTRAEVLTRIEFQNTMAQINEAMKTYEKITGGKREQLFRGKKLHPFLQNLTSLKNLDALNSRGINGKTVELAKHILDAANERVYNELLKVAIKQP